MEAKKLTEAHKEAKKLKVPTGAMVFLTSVAVGILSFFQELSGGVSHATMSLAVDPVVFLWASHVLLYAPDSILRRHEQKKEGQ